jgi:hypothetical protein
LAVIDTVERALRVAVEASAADLAERARDPLWRLHQHPSAVRLRADESVHMVEQHCMAGSGGECSGRVEATSVGDAYEQAARGAKGGGHGR